MLFNSIPFLILLLVTFGLYYLPWALRWQTHVLIVSSFVFYAWEAPWLLWLLVASVSVNSVLSWLVAYGPQALLGRRMAVGLLLNVGLIALFKYGGLGIQTLRLDSTGWGRWIVTLPLPIGISFYTFENISLLVDLLRNRRREQPAFIPNSFGSHVRQTSLFVAFFPHLISGPILKADHFYPQIRPKRLSDVAWDAVFKRCVLGLFLKTVIADNLKDTTQLMEYPMFLGFSSVTLLLLLVAFALQIFADFAGYSLIAVGVAEMFGYRLPDNFNFPYVADSLGDFWRRWHISLSSWLRDYLYIPLGGNRRGEIRTYVNLFLVMAIGGLWHGAAWSYAVWGTYHGLGLALERGVARALGDPFGRLPAIVRRAAVFGFVTLGWLLFKLTDFGHVLLYLQTVGGNWSWRFLGEKPLLTIALFGFPVVLYHGISLSQSAKSWLLRNESAVYGLLLTAVVISHGLPGAFIYFQF